MGECELMNPTVVVGRLVVNKTPGQHRVYKLLGTFSQNAIKYSTQIILNKKKERQNMHWCLYIRLTHKI